MQSVSNFMPSGPYQDVPPSARSNNTHASRYSGKPAIKIDLSSHSLNEHFDIVSNNTRR